MSDSTTKRCTKCGQAFPATTEYFRRDSHTKDGLYPSCKKCLAEYGKKARQTDASKQYHRKYKEQWHRLHGVNPQKRRLVTDNSAQCSKCKQIKIFDDFPHSTKSPIGIASWCKQCFAENKRKKDREKGINPLVCGIVKNELRQCIDCKDWFPNTDQYFYRRKRGSVYPQCKTCHKLKNRTRKTKHAYIAFDQSALFSYWDNRCAICGRPAGLWHSIVLDHWIPLANTCPDNPGTVPWNLLPMCHGAGGCNNQKHDKEAVNWLVGKLGKRKAKRKLFEIEKYFEWTRKQI